MDSLIKKKEEEKKPNLNNFISEAPTIGSTGANAETGQNAALRRRPSDQTPVAGAAGANVPIDPASLGYGAQVVNPANSPSGQLTQQSQPGQVGQQGQPVLPNQQPGQLQPGQLQPGQPTTWTTYQPGQQPGQQAWTTVVRQGAVYSANQRKPAAGSTAIYNSHLVNSHLAQQPVPQGQPQQNANSGLPYPVPTAPGAGGFGTNPPNAAAQPGQPNAPNQGLDMINKILTTPRSQMNMAIPGASGLQIGGGIAGVASVFEGPSIKVYNEREKYQEWEFVYDMKKDKRLLGAAGAMANQQNNNPLGNQNSQQVPNPLTNTGGSSFNNSGNSFNNNSGSSFNNPGTFGSQVVNRNSRYRFRDFPNQGAGARAESLQTKFVRRDSPTTHVWPPLASAF